MPGLWELDKQSWCLSGTGHECCPNYKVGFVKRDTEAMPNWEVRVANQEGM